MSSAGTVTAWINQLGAGDDAAAQKLWECYFQRLVSLARVRLRGKSRAAADEEDVALSAFDSFCRGIQAGRFPRLDDRDRLWQLLMVITARKAIDVAQREGRRKRGGGKVRHASAVPPEDLVRVLGPEPTPALAAQLAEECQRLLERLGDAQLRSVALWKMEGYANEEIAARLGRSLPTVERKLRRIRDLWAREIGEPG
jgi:DNA-directed RNA polymerase specialized sigma24 family protein